MKKSDSKKRLGRIRLVIFWIICIALIVWMLNLPRNKKNGTADQTSIGSNKANSVTELEMIKIEEFIKALDFAEIGVLEENPVFSDNLQTQKLIFAQMEYLKANPGAENDKEQIYGIYRNYFENVSAEVFSTMYGNELQLAMDNRIENQKGTIITDGIDVLTGTSLYVYVTKVEKTAGDTYLVTVENVHEIDLSKIRSDNLLSNSAEELIDTYLNYVNDDNITTYQHFSAQYKLKLAVDNGRIYIKEF